MEPDISLLIVGPCECIRRRSVSLVISPQQMRHSIPRTADPIDETMCGTVTWADGRSVRSTTPGSVSGRALDNALASADGLLVAFDVTSPAHVALLGATMATIGDFAEAGVPVVVVGVQGGGAFPVHDDSGGGGGMGESCCARWVSARQQPIRLVRSPVARRRGGSACRHATSRGAGAGPGEVQTW
jgi:hypothetical protein